MTKFDLALKTIRDYTIGTEYLHKVYLVGGCVRDKLLDITIKDIDIMVDMPNGGFSQVDSTTDRQLIYDFLVNNSPDLSKYAPKEWDEKTAAFVNGALDAINRYAQLGSVPGNIAAITNNNPLANNPVATSVPPTPQFNVPNPQFNSPVNNIPTPQPTFTTPSVPNVALTNEATPAPASITGIDLPPVVEVSNVPQPPVGLGLGLSDIVGNI